MWSSHDSGAFPCEFCQGQSSQLSVLREEALGRHFIACSGTSRNCAPLLLLQQASDTNLVIIRLFYYFNEHSKELRFKWEVFPWFTLVQTSLLPSSTLFLPYISSLPRPLPSSLLLIFISWKRIWSKWKTVYEQLNVKLSEIHGRGCWCNQMTEQSC